MGAIAFVLSLLVWAGVVKLIKHVEHQNWINEISIDDRVHH